MDIKCGDRFARWTIIEQVPHSGNKRYFKCRCDCGTVREVSLSHLSLGNSKSCGCYGIESARNRATKHGHSGDHLYQTWVDMHRRCSNPKHRRFKDWGGRGITVCDEWKTFDSFKEWALGNGFDPKLLIDRKDNDKGYSPENCRWSTMKEQGNNRRDNVRIEHDGKIMTITEWAEFAGMSFGKLRWRISNGWEFSKAIK